MFGTNLSAGVELRQSLLAEGDTGLLFSTVTWSDGASEDVGTNNLGGLDEITAVSGTPNVVMYEPQRGSNSELFWKMGVAVAASRECVSSVAVNWTVCGSAVASTGVPMFLDMPDATSAELQATATRVTAMDDDARLSPINVPASTNLMLDVSFSDVTKRRMTSDSRV